MLNLYTTIYYTTHNNQHMTMIHLFLVMIIDESLSPSKITLKLQVATSYFGYGTLEYVVETLFR